MKRAMPWDGQVDVISFGGSSSSDADVQMNDASGHYQSNNNITVDQPAVEMTSEDALIRRAEMYQDYMNQIPIPACRGSVIPFTSWTGLGKSIKKLYEQPLHYLTNILIKQWDKMRIDNTDELDTIVHPCKAEATIWLIEEVHRHSASHYYIAKLWLEDPMYHVFIDHILPEL